MLKRRLLEAQEGGYDQVVEQLYLKQLDELADHCVHHLPNLLIDQCLVHLLFRNKALILFKLKLDLHVPHDDLAKLLLQVLLG